LERQKQLHCATSNAVQRETVEMLFSVIYSVDAPEDVAINRYAPPQPELWDQTEGDECYEYGYLEGLWSEGSHRKYCALLNRHQFDAFVSELGLYAEDVHTLGSIGAPGCGYGCSPAISFTADDPDAILSAYVTPLPEVEKELCDEHDWDRVRDVVLSVYG
jgi:hypothetical protein